MRLRPGHRHIRAGAPWLIALALGIAPLPLSNAASPARAAPAEQPPAYRVDTSWPQLPLPNSWLLGDVSSVAVDRHNHVWVLHRPGRISPLDILAGETPPRTKCCVAAPPVLEFDAEGRLLRGWGGPQLTPDWFDSEHGIFVDDEDNVWLLGAGAHDGELLKFTPDGKLLLRIGRKGEFVTADDPTMLGMPTDLYVDIQRREVFVSDGYRNHRVIVFDSQTGALKRQWTAFGKKVDPAYVTTAAGFDPAHYVADLERFSMVHCIAMIGGELHVCDRTNNRIQIFTPEGKYLREIFFNRELGGGIGSTWDVAALPGQPDRLIVLDGTNSEIAVLDRRTGDVVASYLSKGHQAGQMHWPHQLAVDQQGRLYVAEVGNSARIQRFVPNANQGRKGK